MSDDYAAMLGITEEEIDNQLKLYVSAMSKSLETDVDDLRSKLREWYNGYQMSDRGEPVYNPFSLLSALNSKKITNYWFSTGTPSFLIKLIKEIEFDLAELEHMEGHEMDFKVFEIENISLLSLLYQTGYLTLSGYDQSMSLYSFKFPNREVDLSFAKSLLNSFCADKQHICTSNLASAVRAFRVKDFEQVIYNINKILEMLPYDLYIQQEKHYHSIFFLIIKLLGLNIHAEVSTHRGRADAVIITDQEIYIFEFKYNKTADSAIKQIKDKKYYSGYENLNKQIFLFGINFDGETRLVDDWHYEKLSHLC